MQNAGDSFKVARVYLRVSTEALHRHFRAFPQRLIELRGPEQDVTQSAAHSFRLQRLFAHGTVRGQRIGL